MRSSAPAGVVGGITTILVMPAKLAAGDRRAVAADAGRDPGVAHRRARELGAVRRPASPRCSSPRRRGSSRRRRSSARGWPAVADDREVRRRDREARPRSLPWHCAQLRRRARRVGVDVRSASASPRSRRRCGSSCRCAVAAVGMWFAGFSVALEVVGVAVALARSRRSVGCAASATLKVPAVVPGPGVEAGVLGRRDCRSAWSARSDTSPCPSTGRRSRGRRCSRS